MVKQNTPKLIILIHGTFAHDAAWIQSDSEFTKCLKEKLTSPNEIVKFNWSGKNSSSKRMSAGDELVQFLEKKSAEYPDFEKVIIAHSHGGNVALYALKKWMTSAEETIKLITLSTPFLNVKPRNFENNIGFIVGIFNFMILPILVFLSYAIIAYPLVWILSRFINIENHTTSLITLGIISFVIYTFILIPHFGNKIMDWEYNLPANIKHIHDKFSIDKINPCIQLTVIYDRIDEVKIYLGLMTNIWEWLFKGIDAILSIGRKAFIFLLLFGMGLGVVILSILHLISKFIYSFHVDKIVHEWIDVFIWIVFLPLPSTLVLISILLLIRSNPLVLGNENFSMMLFLNTTTSAIPKVEIKINTVPFKISKKRLLSLRHSIYLSELVLKTICIEIEKQPELFEKQLYLLPTNQQKGDQN